MTREEIFNLWAPPSAIWSAWAKPVLFSHLRTIGDPAGLAAMDVNWADRADGSTAMVVDLPGAEGVAVGLSLASKGYRPVPLYNACPSPMGQMSQVDVDSIIAAVIAATAALGASHLRDDAPPAFLLDANRRVSSQELQPGMFDNRSISLPTDFPSGNLLHSRGIKRVILVQASIRLPQADLSHTLRRWQDAGVEILAKELDQPAPPHPIVVQKPQAFRLLWYNLLATLGLKRSPLGGFGGLLPLPSAG